MALPQLTDEQRKEALEKAAQARHERAELREKIKSGKVTLEEVLDSDDPIANRMKVSALIESLPGYGKAKAAKIMDELGIPKRILNSCLVQRSVDTFVGMPFNIAGYGILTHFLAKITGHMAGAFVHFGFDVHLYDNHMEGVEELMKREPPKESDPVVIFPHEWAELDDFKWEGVQVCGYSPLPWIKVPVAV